jgi:hypothetical protein
LYLAARALKNCHDAGRVPTKNPELLRLTVPASYRAKAADALNHAQALLKDQGR